MGFNDESYSVHEILKLIEQDYLPKISIDLMELFYPSEYEKFFGEKRVPSSWIYGMDGGYHPSGWIYGMNGGYHPSGWIYGMDGGYHPSGWIYGMDGGYHPSGWIYGMDGRYHPPKNYSFDSMA